MRIREHALAGFFAALLLTCCFQDPNTAQASTSQGKDNNATAAAPVSGKTAFWEMYKAAHSWATDLTPLSLENKSIPGMPNDSGKAAVWSATFGSLKRHEARTFTYAVAAHPPDIAKGISVGRGIPWGGPSRDALPFDSSDFSVDSDAAYKTAYSQASAWLAKHPGKEARLTLGNASRFPAPVWYVLWGDKKSGYAIFVNAKTGAVIK
jgi:hypothetical protein